jgi:hypothetical protein
MSEVDELARTDLWEAWRLAQFETGLALDAWYEASKGSKARAFATYNAALDAEAFAAELLAISLERVPDRAVEGALAAP